LEFDVSCDPAPCPPFTDSVHYPMQFGIPGSTQPEPIVIGLDARGGTVEPGEPTACGNMGRTTWYAVDWYEGQTATGVRLTTDGSDYDTAIAIYQTPIGVWQPEFSQLTPVTCAVSGPQRAAAVFSVVPNTRTWVQVGGRDGAGGYLDLSVACDPYCPPGNDHSGSAWEIFAGQTYDIDTRGATLEVGEPAACGAVEHTVWFRTTQNAPFEMTVNTADSNFDTLIAVYPVTAFSPPGGTTQSIACGTNSVSFSGAEGVSYLVQIGSPASDPNGGALVATMTCEGDGCNYGGGQGGGGLPVPDTGGSGGVVTGPETGSGGHAAMRR
jgi:hypothetical protein